MKKALIFLGIIIACINIASSQNVKKAFKHLYKQNYDKSREVFSEMYKVNKYDAMASYGLAVMYADKNYSNYNLFQAYRLIKETERNFDKLASGELSEMREYFNIDSVEANTKRIDDLLFQEVAKTGSLKDLNDFLEKCQDSRNYRKALDLKYELEFEKARQVGTIDAFNQFIEEYPYSTFVSEAKKLRAKIAFKNAKQTNTEAAYNNYIEKYGDGSENLEEAKRMRNIAAFNELKNKQSVEACTQFIEKYPDAPQIPEVKKLRDDLIYAETKNAKSVETFNIFLANHHEGKRYQEIFDRKSDFMGKQLHNINRYVADNKEWIKGFDKQMRQEMPGAIAISAAGDIVFASNIEQQNKWYNDIWLIKLNKTGKLVWENLIKAPYDEKVHSITITNDNAIILAGHYGARGAINGKIWLQKRSATGEKLWNKIMDKSGATDLAITPDNHIVFAAYKGLPDGNRDIIIMKLNKNGTTVWTKPFEGTGKTKRGKGIPKSVHVDNQGNIYAIGDYWMTKLDPKGNVLWENYYPEYYKSYSSALSASNDLYVVGRFYDFTRKEKSDYWIAKYDATGKKLWEQTIDRAGFHDIAYSIQINNDENIFVAGLTDQGDDKDDDIWILKLDNAGNITEEMNFGTNEREKKPLLAITPDGKPVLLAGRGLNSDIVLIKFK